MESYRSEQLFFSLTGTRAVHEGLEDAFYILDSETVRRWQPGRGNSAHHCVGNGAGSSLNQLNEPWDMLVMQGNEEYLADTKNNGVVRWTSGATEGVVVAEGSGMSSWDDQF